MTLPLSGSDMKRDGIELDFEKKTVQEIWLELAGAMPVPPPTRPTGSALVVVADPQSEKALPPNAVFKAVNSLYDDELRPNLGLVRRRLKELYDVLVPITDLRKVIQSLVKANILIVQGDPQEPVLTLAARPGS